MKIHPNKNSALAALKEYRIALDALSERTGVIEVYDDSCEEIYCQVKFLGDDGVTVCGYSD